MYDFAGEWLVSVGLPAKSGVSGGIFAVLPGRLGIGVFSPRLDAQGNSVRGIARLPRPLARPRPASRPARRADAPPVRARLHAGDARSKRSRAAAQRAALRAAAARAAVVELQGELGFSASEALARAVERPGDAPELVVVDLSRVVRADAGGARFIVSLADRMHERGGRLALCPAGSVDGAALEGLPEAVEIFADLDLALEWCEDDFLRRVGEEPAPRGRARRPRAARRPHRGGARALEPELGSVTAVAGTLLVRQGEPASEVFLVTRGTLSVVREGSDGRGHRLTTLSAGGTFGELASSTGGRARPMCARTPRSTCRTLRYAAIDALAVSDPATAREGAAQPARRRRRDAARRQRGDRPPHALMDPRR